MNLEQVIDRLLYLRDAGYASGSEEVIGGDANGTVMYRIEDIETGGGQVVVKLV